MAAQSGDHSIVGDHVLIRHFGEHFFRGRQVTAFRVIGEQPCHENAVGRETRGENLAMDDPSEDVASFGESRAAGKQQGEGGPVGEEVLMGHSVAEEEEEGAGVGMMVGDGAEEVFP